jgi:hypothetical protein
VPNRSRNIVAVHHLDRKFREIDEFRRRHGCAFTLGEREPASQAKSPDCECVTKIAGPILSSSATSAREMIEAEESPTNNYIILCGEIKLLIDGFCGEGLPTIDFSHVDLTGSKQRPEQHGGRVRRRQHSLRFDPALELLV